MKSADIDQLRTTRDADTMDFVVTRTTPQPGRTFSQEAMEELHQALGEYVMARINYHWQDRSGDVPGPSNLKIEVKVTIDDKSYPPFLQERPWYVIDGSARTLDG